MKFNNKQQKEKNKSEEIQSFILNRDCELSEDHAYVNSEKSSFLKIDLRHKNLMCGLAYVYEYQSSGHLDKYECKLCLYTCLKRHEIIAHTASYWHKMNYLGSHYLSLVAKMEYLYITNKSEFKKELNHLVWTEIKSNVSRYAIKVKEYNPNHRQQFFETSLLDDSKLEPSLPSDTREDNENMWLDLDAENSNYDYIQPEETEFEVTVHRPLINVNNLIEIDCGQFNDYENYSSDQTNTDVAMSENTYSNAYESEKNSWIVEDAAFNNNNKNLPDLSLIAKSPEIQIEFLTASLLLNSLPSLFNNRDLNTITTISIEKLIKDNHDLNVAYDLLEYLKSVIL